MNGRGQGDARSDPGRRAVISADQIDAVIFDMDGVVTDTATIHEASWARLFDRFLRDRAAETGEVFRPFTAEDYRRSVDGKPRDDGVRSFLATRNIVLPAGDPSDPPDAETVSGLGSRKDGIFQEHLRDHGVEVFSTSVTLLDELRAAGIRTAVISASQHLDDVLAAGGVANLFDVRLGGIESTQLGLAGKPAPAIFLEAASRLGVPVARAAVVEDALAGVEAGRAGGFALVIGVDRSGHASELAASGADVVVRDLSQVRVSTGRRVVAVRDLPAALDRWAEIVRRIEGSTFAVFLDYDGTLTPIVDRPEDALLSAETRHAVERLASRCEVAVISGRDLDDVRSMVGLDGLVYAGSHGFDIAGPAGLAEQHGREFLPDLDRAEHELVRSLDPIPGARLERKRFAIAVHFRQVNDGQAHQVHAVVRRVAAAYPRLRMTTGKKVIELRPDIDWDKGHAVRRLLQVLGLDREGVVPIYVGDDVTDEDAFRTIGDAGVGIVVNGEDDARHTTARYALADTEAVRVFLEALSENTRGASG